ncbi:hypothetical protein B0A54_04269 [Friedmanniomyces endolithicus]|uniref:Peptidase A1 domain-containing protein n=2 Tax=Dothideomycetidae TaxID=451867 RepID=A0A4U0V969_9PEZI|nr:hypothetical protein B0A54_04269 [Friedmanniomyces endolithicus]
MTSLTLTFVERPPTLLSFTAGTVPLTTVFSPLPTFARLESDGKLLPFRIRGRRGGTLLSGHLSEPVLRGRELDDRRQQCDDFDMLSFLASSCEATLGNTPASNGYPTVLINNSTVQYSNAFTAFAPTIAVAWALTDLDRYTPASAPIFATDLTAATVRSSTATTISASQSSPTTSSSTLSTPIQSSSSLSTGATAGIGVGAALGGLALIALEVWLFLRRRKSRAAGGADDNHGKAELPGESAEKQHTKAGELSTRGEIFEFGGDARPAELEPDVRYELEGGFQGHEAGGTMRQSR